MDPREVYGDVPLPTAVPGRFAFHSVIGDHQANQANRAGAVKMDYNHNLDKQEAYEHGHAVFP